MQDAALLVCDWGTTNLRAWALDSTGAVLAARDFPLGAAKLPRGEAPAAFAREVRPALGAEHTPALLCGAVGSDHGWTTVPYRDCPATLSDIARGVVEAPDADGVRIAPGVRFTGFNGRGDVMRGEETQLFGWLTLHPDKARGRHMVCHPGTHTKWMVVEEGRLTAFVSTMTGELFAVLTEHSVLRTSAPADVSDAFDEGLDAAGNGGGLSARLFTARARLAGRGAPPKSAASYLSGLLVGADVAATPGLLGFDVSEGVALLGDQKLCALYARALQRQDVSVETFDGEAAAVAGLWALHCAEVPHETR